MRLKKIFALILILQLTLGSFTPLSPKTYAVPMNDNAENIDDADPSAADDETPARKGLRFRLSEGAETSEKPAPLGVVAQASKLSESETARVLQIGRASCRERV